MTKTQVWLREDERDLVYRSLQFLSEQCNEEDRLISGRVAKFSLKHSRDSIKSVAQHFASKVEPQS